MQIVHILPNGASKWTWLLSKLVEFTVCQYRFDRSRFVIPLSLSVQWEKCSSLSHARIIARNWLKISKKTDSLVQKGQRVDLIKTTSFVSVGLIHGDMAQFDRSQVINDFKKRDMLILIATDVAGR